MKNAAIVLGIAMFLGGLWALYVGIISMDRVPCFIEDSNCDPFGSTDTSGTIFFPVGMIGVILGSALWTAGSGNNVTGGRTRGNPLAFIGFFGIFGLTFLGIGAVMFIADRQPGVDHTTNVLTIIGLIFGLVGIASIGAEVVFRVSGAHEARILATGIRGRATVTAVRDSNVTVNMNPMITLDLRVEIPGQPVFTQSVRQVISRLKVGDYRPGLILSVAADSAKPRDIVIDWDRSPIGHANATTDPVTGQPLTVAASSIIASGQPMVTVGGRSMSGGDIASILRAAADQVAAGGTVSHPEVASVVGTAGQWTATAQPLSQADVANLLRTIADKATAGQSMTSTELGALLRQAAQAAGTAGDGTTQRPTG